MKLSRSEQEQTARALSTKAERGNRAMEERISVRMGQEESTRVDRAVSEDLKESRDIEAGAIIQPPPVIPEVAMSGWIFDEGVMQERNRCLLICAQFPDNLMAKHLASMIRSGK